MHGPLLILAYHVAERGLNFFFAENFVRKQLGVLLIQIGQYRFSNGFIVVTKLAKIVFLKLLQGFVVSRDACDLLMTQPR